MRRPTAVAPTAVVVRGMSGGAIVLIVVGAVFALCGLPGVAVLAYGLVQGDTEALKGQLSLVPVLLGAFMILVAVRAMTATRAVVDGWGIVVGRAGRPRLRVGWHELAAIGVSWRERVSYNAASSGIPLYSTRCQLDLYPADASFFRRHPELARWWQQHGDVGLYRVNVGGRAAIQRFDAVFRRYARTRYLGVGAEALLDGQAEAASVARPAPAPRAEWPGTAAVTVDFGRERRITSLAVGIVLVFVAAPMLGVGLAVLVTDTGVEAGVLTGLGAIGLLSAVPFVVRFARAEGAMRLVIDARGLRYRERGGRSFAVEWAELGGVGLAWTRNLVLSTSRSACLYLFPAGVQCRARHPEMEPWFATVDGRACYRLAIGGAASAGEVTAAVRRYAPRLFLGIRT